MVSYLLVLHNLDESPGLVAVARDLSSRDPDAEFVLLVPASAPAFYLFIEPRCSATRFAGRRARRMRDRLLSAGVNLRATRGGNFDPFRALEDALRYSEYAAVVIAAPEHRLLHFIRCDLACRLARKFPKTRVVHAPDQPHRRSMGSDWESGAVTTSVQH